MSTTRAVVTQVRLPVGESCPASTQPLLIDQSNSTQLLDVFLVANHSGFFTETSSSKE